ncbi:hypothetical protein RHMOL_Rhmol08G0196300 [Rhododendron molle]|uniref:Uncharacterized protein n=1 Tax=Rhododendron molle TaxID=49168 RepID=A0ACC0MQJ0_RHOML|nr:hypothetical protein RHMOL_Rhmol08G0196300 [Rhododendron molle]
MEVPTPPGDHYWSMMDNVKIKFREYYWEYGKSLFQEKSLFYMHTSAQRNWNFEGATNSVELEMLNQYCKNLHVINNSLEDGWGEFYDDNHLQQEFKVIFGYQHKWIFEYQHKWIFEVIILNENLNRVKYGPMNANSDLIDNNAQQCHGLSSLILSTSCMSNDTESVSNGVL